MPHEASRFHSRDGLELYENRWLPEGDPAAVVVLVHGFMEHSGRYAEVAGALNRQGYAVYAPDLRGHGKSPGDRVFIHSFDQYVDDLETFLERVRARHAGRPFFLFGHSMGGSIVALLAITRRPDVRGVVLSAPAVQVGRQVFPILRRLAAMLSTVFPRMRLVRMGCNWLSRDPEVVADFRSDPLVFQDRFPVRTGAEILHAAQSIQDRMEALRHPLLLLHGTHDRVTDPEGSRRLYAGAGSTDKTLKLYEGLYHDLLHEPERQQVTADLLEWLAARRQSVEPPAGV